MTDKPTIADAIAAVREAADFAVKWPLTNLPVANLVAAIDRLSDYGRVVTERDALLAENEKFRDGFTDINKALLSSAEHDKTVYLQGAADALRERNAARAELASQREINRNLSESVGKLDVALAEARAEIERLRQDNDALRHGVGYAAEKLGYVKAAPPPEDAMEARPFVEGAQSEAKAGAPTNACAASTAGESSSISKDAQAAQRVYWEAYEAHQVEGQDAAIKRVDAALTAAREAERRRWQDATQPGVTPDGLRAYIEGREMAVRKDERERHRALVEVARCTVSAFCEHGTPQLKHDREMQTYWSPSARMMETQLIMALRDALAALDAALDQ